MLEPVEGLVGSGAVQLIDCDASPARLDDHPGMSRLTVRRKTDPKLIGETGDIAKGRKQHGKALAIEGKGKERRFRQKPGGMGKSPLHGVHLGNEVVGAEGA